MPGAASGPSFRTRLFVEGWLLLVWGTVALVIGLFTLMDPARSLRLLVALAAVFVLVGSIAELIAMRGPGSLARSVFAIVGAVVVILQLELSTLVAGIVATEIVALVLIVNGVILAFEAARNRNLGRAAISCLLVVLGVLIGVNPLLSAPLLVTGIAVALAVGGAVLIGIGLVSLAARRRTTGV